MSIYKGDKLVADKGSKGPGIPGIPDWTRAVKLTANTLFSNGYTAPGNGIVVGTFTFKNRIATLDCMIGGITVAQAVVPSSTSSSVGNVQCPIGQGNKLLLRTKLGNLSVQDLIIEMYFVPYKAQ